MQRSPRGLVSRSLIAALLFVLGVVPGWVLGGLTERWTGSGLLDWVVTGAGTALAVRVLAPRGSYRPRDGWLGLIPLYGWYLTCVLCWRVALLPYRDWEPRRDELWRARWLTGELLGLWRSDPPVAGRTETLRAGTGLSDGHRSR
ncbi:hypothetical protein HH310_15590 [Actinoplanes sp. TBRC 11911]|uniref:hypothetical protein n=1 Tax=Actinoplanes sp. TBRC 11911 TaxID=2729386 RepID=UPI00145E3057|nr:hypothetical protein [Actinoplanes sp. TBRC 11911]NMO52612.1 hypothetical protein [Actinoplanes sp. TBRC 11911]